MLSKHPGLKAQRAARIKKENQVKLLERAFQVKKLEKEIPKKLDSVRSKASKAPVATEAYPEPETLL